MTDGPINIGVANKFREEIDYRSASNSPLGFTRYYNSHSQNASNAHHYRHVNLESANGLEAYGSLASQVGEQGTRLAKLGLGAVGVGWRHAYQRSIWRASGSLITNAFVYRHDAQVLTFTKYSGQWYGQADVKIRLQEILDGGGVQTGWKLTLQDDSTETYDLGGRLLAIRSRSGVEQALSYDGCGRLQTVTDSFGRSLSLEYTATCDPANPQRVHKVTGLPPLLLTPS
jgi:YD repeat-containing protein